MSRENEIIVKLNETIHGVTSNTQQVDEMGKKIKTIERLLSEFENGALKQLDSGFKVCEDLLDSRLERIEKMAKKMEEYLELAKKTSESTAELKKVIENKAK